MITSLIIATYNWPEALELVLKSVLTQSSIPNEIIIADDGSTITTKETISFLKTQNSINIKHIWQEDNGFQKTRILNKAIVEAKGDYIIQIDGDLILHYNFIKDHLSKAKKGQFIHGSRVFLNPELTKQSIQNKDISFSIFQKGLKNRFNTIHSDFLESLLSKQNSSLKGTRGCNFSFWKDDVIAVNGYNQNMIGWGKEDSELSARLMNNGLRKLQLKFNAICYHLNHKIVSRKGININNQILNITVSERKTYCKNGINKYAKRN